MVERLRRFIPHLAIALVVAFAGYQYAQNVKANTEADLAKKHSEEISRWEKALHDSVVARQATISRLQARSDSLARRVVLTNVRLEAVKKTLADKMDSLPELTPAVCEPYAVALSTCQLQAAVQDSVIGDLNGQLAAEKEASALLTHSVADETRRADTLSNTVVDLREALDKSGCRIKLGITSVGCPSRGVVAGVSILGTLILTR